MTPARRKQLADLLLSMGLRRAALDWEVKHSRGQTLVMGRLGKRVIVQIDIFADRTWFLSRGGRVVASGPDPKDPHQDYSGHGWVRLMADNIISAYQATTEEAA